MQSFRLQLVEKYFRANHTVCLHCRKSNKNDSKGIANFLKEISCEVPGKDHPSIFGIAKYDRDALEVSEKLNETKARIVHHCNKMCRTSIGKLVKSRAKVLVNLF